MGWEIAKALEQQQAIEEQERRLKEERERKIEATLSQVADENSANAHALGLSRAAFHSLASQPDLYHKYLKITSTHTVEASPKVSIQPGEGWDPLFKLHHEMKTEDQ